MLADTPILVEAERGDQRAGVRRDREGRLWIAHWTAGDPQRAAGTQLEGLEPRQIRGEEWSIVGGRLPAGAQAADVRGDGGRWYRAALGHGAWVRFIPGDLGAPGVPPVRFLDRMGALVSRVPPARVAAAGNLDAAHARLLAMGRSGLGATCPACGHADWRTAPAERGGGEVVFCAVCGHTDGAVYAFYGSTAASDGL